ncbi:MAG: hypothetical protein AB3X44_01540, partial [Leptothrix sp. (in: b-proteobacteria)]
MSVTGTVLVISQPSNCASLKGSVGIFVCEAGPDFQGMRWTNRWWILRCHTVESIAVGDGELI